MCLSTRQVCPYIAEATQVSSSMYMLAGRSSESSARWCVVCEGHQEPDGGMPRGETDSKLPSHTHSHT